MARDNDENGANEKYMYSDKINVNILTSFDGGSRSENRYCVPRK